MKNRYPHAIIILLANIFLHALLIAVFALISNNSVAQCSQSTPTFNVNLSTSPKAFWISPDTIRNGSCCNSGANDKCIEFVITLHPSATGISFNVFSGAMPSGALYYQVNCLPPVPIGAPICLSGAGPHRITFCKPGNNNNRYIINSVGSPYAGNDLVINNGCIGTLYSYGYDPNSINWTSVYPSTPGTFDHLLNCTTCDSVLVSGDPGVPYVDYQVCGYSLGACDSVYHCDTLRVTFNKAITVQFNPKKPMVCHGDSTTPCTAMASGGTTPYQYIWSNGDTLATTNLKPGWNYVYIQDSTNCPAVLDSVFVGQFTNPITANAGNDTTLCFDLVPVPLAGSVQGATGGVWSNGSGNYSNGPTSLNNIYQPTLSELSNGFTRLILSTTGNQGCPGDQDTLNIFFKRFTANINLIVSDPFCNGFTNGQAVLNLSGGGAPFNVLWSADSSNTTWWQDSLGAGQYFIKVTDMFGCDSLLPFTITEPAPVTVQTTSSNISCYGGTDGTITTVAGGGTPPYLFNITGGPTQSNGNFTGLGAGTYTVKVTDSKGCDSSIVVTLTQPSPIRIDTLTLKNPTCYLDSNGQVIVQAKGGASPYRYAWNGGQIGPMVNNVPAGNYTVTVTDANNCSINYTIQLVQPDSVWILSSANDTMCPGASVQITGQGQGGSGTYQYTWNNGLGNTPSHNVSPPQPTLYTVRAKDSNGCLSRPKNIMVFVRLLYQDSLFVFNGGDVCVGNSTNVWAAYAPYNGGGQLTWQPVLPPNVGPHNVTPTSDTYYRVRITNICGAYIEDSTLVKVHPYPQIDLPAMMAQGCEPLDVSFTANTGSQDPGTTYSWDFGNGHHATGYSVNYTYPDAGQYQVNLTAISGFGCTSTSGSNHLVTVFEGPTAAFNFNPHQINILNPEVEFINLSQGAISYDWNFGDGTASTLKDPIHEYSDTGVYAVKLVVKNFRQCTDTAIRELKIEPYFVVYIPNTITANNDGRNDVLYVKGVGIDKDDFNMSIFDRWGEQIFTTSNIEEGWNARKDGYMEIVPLGTYVYKVQVKDIVHGKHHEYVGHVNVVR